jgi:hypothetical protein
MCSSKAFFQLHVVSVAVMITLKIIIQLTLAHIRMTYTTTEKKPTLQHNKSNNKTLHVY